MMFQRHPRDLAADHEAFVAQLRHEIHGHGPVASEPHAVRRWLGRQLVRIGARLAAEPSMRPIRSL